MPDTGMEEHRREHPVYLSSLDQPRCCREIYENRVVQFDAECTHDKHSHIDCEQRHRHRGGFERRPTKTPPRIDYAGSTGLFHTFWTLLSDGSGYRTFSANVLFTFAAAQLRGSVGVSVTHCLALVHFAETSGVGWDNRAHDGSGESPLRTVVAAYRPYGRRDRSQAAATITRERPVTR